jgi:hypothetical protein
MKRTAIVLVLLTSIAVLRPHGASTAPHFVFDPSFPQLPAGKAFGDV